MRLDTNFSRYPTISERDINLLLVEELHCSPGFQQRFLRAAAIDAEVKADASGIQAWTEVCLPGIHAAEIDVLVQVDADIAHGGSVQLLIENKIDANFQLLQPERYHAQAGQAVAGAEFHQAKTVLLAPQGYLAVQQDRARLFNTHVSYEQLRQWIVESADSPAERRRAEVKQVLLNQAVRKQSRLLPAVISPFVSSCWRDIYELAVSEFADLAMPSPTEKGPSARSVDLPCLTRGGILRKARLEYVLKKGDLAATPGTVTILLPGLADRHAAAAAQLAASLAPDMILRKAGSSLGITISVPAVDPGLPLGPQLGHLVQGLHAARHLRDWFHENQIRLEAIAATPD